jgi:glutamate/tyrosine decarboxylase-like PLP-dependent enzyme
MQMTEFCTKTSDYVELALLGIGSDNCVKVPVNTRAQIDTNALRAMLADRLRTHRPVYAVVAVVGTTEEGSVDPLDDILNLRDEFGRQGLSFVVHADAAWGGYFASMIESSDAEPIGAIPYVPIAELRQSVVKDFKALARTDSITIDPHKAGYIPYPAGGLCYRDGRMRFLLTWSAPYLNQSKKGESIGIYGIEGR